MFALSRLPVAAPDWAFPISPSLPSGAAIVGPHAGELIAECALAIGNGMKAGDLSASIHTYPTLAQINQRVADVRLKDALTPRAKMWIKRIFRLQGG